MKSRLPILATVLVPIGLLVASEARSQVAFNEVKIVLDVPALPPLLAGIKSGDFGLTFENQGLRARIRFDAQTPPP